MWCYSLMNQLLVNIPIIFLCTVKLLKIQACQNENKTSSTDNAVPIYCWSGETVHHMHTQTHTHTLSLWMLTGARFNSSLLSQNRNNSKTQSAPRADDHSWRLQHIWTVKQPIVTGQKKAAAVSVEGFCHNLSTDVKAGVSATLTLFSIGKTTF